MPRNNWSQYLRGDIPPTPTVFERVESIAQTPVVEGSVPPGSIVTFDDAAPEGSYPAYTFYSGPQWIDPNWSSGSWGISDPLAQPQQRKGPSQDSIRHWYTQGQHSRIPTCCIEWFCTRWARATKTSNARYTRLLKKMHEEHKYLWQPGFIPCPKTIRAKDIVFIHHCDDRCRLADVTAEDIRRAKEHLLRTMYSGQVGRTEGVVFRDSAPTPVQEMRNQREDNTRLSGTSVVFRPRP